jgi:hypothetical protein
MARQELSDTVCERYRSASRKQKTVILTEFVNSPDDTDKEST